MTTLKAGTVVEVRPQGFVNGVLVAKGPAGDPGPKGDRGDAGPQGDPGPKGDKGDTGSTGLTGPANTLAVGTVTTSSPGGSADATVTGSAPNQTLNLTIPRGVQGPQGDPGPKGDPGTGNVDTVNGISGPNVVLAASDVGARPSSYVPDWSEVTSKPSTFAPSAHTHAESEITGLVADLAAKIATSSKGVANGVASLDSAGKVPVTQLPASVMEYQGVWNASTNTPTLADGTGNSGDQYRVTVAGTRDLGSGSQTFAVGDFVIYDGAVWQLAHGGADAVQSVAGLTGTITSTGLKTALGAGAASGLATLGSDGKLDPTQVPSSTSSDPAGVIKMYGGSAVPSGWLLCDGSTFSSTSYPLLAAALGDTWGAHSGTTYFLPDLRERFIQGSGPTHAVGAVDGTAVASRTQAHTHSVPAHTHPVNITTGDGSSSAFNANNTAGATSLSRTTHTHTVSGNTDSGGSGTSGASATNAIPFGTVAFIVRAA